MTSSPMPEQEHGRSPPETVTMATGEPQPQLPGLGDPTAGRSDVAMATLVTGGAGDEEEEMLAAEGLLGGFVPIVSSPWGPILAPTPLSSMMPAAAQGEKQKQCVECGATETPQWRMQPMGLGALCNACRIRLRPAEALREPMRVHIPPPATATATATATTVISESPAANGWISKAWIDSDEYQLKVTSPRLPGNSRSPAPATAPEEKKQKRKRKRKQWQPRKSSKMGHHCKSSSPNFEPSEHACKHREAVQLRQKKHKGKEQQQHQPQQPAAMQPRAGDGVEQHLPLPPAQTHGADELGIGKMPISVDQLLRDTIDRSPETQIVYGVGGDLQMEDPSSLEEFLFNRPAAPMLIDDDDEDLIN